MSTNNYYFLTSNGGFVSADELYHHGIKGQKWGIRRYQNYDGSYTKKGLANYNKAQSDYDSAKETANRTKEAYKSGTATKAQYKNVKAQLKGAKRKLNASYDQLKMDKLADEGKKLYQKGKTITKNTVVNYLAQVGVVTGSAIVNTAINGKFGNTRAANISSAVVALGGTAVNVAMAERASMQNKRLRAYYSYSRSR